MIDPKDRLGLPNSQHDIQSLKQHPFFAGVDFDNLEKYNIREMLEEEDQERLAEIRNKKSLKAGSSGNFEEEKKQSFFINEESGSDNIVC